jgi:hypothetical protein
MLPEFVEGIKGLSAGVTSILSHTFLRLILMAFSATLPIAYKPPEVAANRRSCLALALQTLNRKNQYSCPKRQGEPHRPG